MKHLTVRPCAEFPSDNPHLHAGEPAEFGSGFDWESTERQAKELSLLWKKKADAPEVFPRTLGVEELEHLTPKAHPAVEEHAVDDASDPFITELLEWMTDGSDELLMEEAGADQAMLEESGEARTLPRVEVAPRVPEPPLAELAPVRAAAQPLPPLFFELTPTPAHVSPWTELTATLSRHLLGEGYTRAAALIAPLLGGELVDLSRLPPNSLELLVAGDVAETRAGRVVSTSAFRDSARAFREEFYGGGLHASHALFWLSQVLFALTGGDTEEEALEDTLRQLGVADLLERAA